MWVSDTSQGLNPKRLKSHPSPGFLKALDIFVINDNTLSLLSRLSFLIALSCDIFVTLCVTDFQAYLVDMLK